MEETGQASFAVGPTAQSTDGVLLDDALDACFGAGFARVMEFEVERRLGCTKMQALTTAPDALRSTLKDVFLFDWVVDLIFRQARARLVMSALTTGGMEELSRTEGAITRFVEKRPPAAPR